MIRIPTLERYLARQILSAVGLVLLGFLALFGFFDLIGKILSFFSVGLVAVNIHRNRLAIAILGQGHGVAPAFIIERLPGDAGR